MAATARQQIRWDKYRIKLIKHGLTHLAFAELIGVSDHHLRMVVYGERPMMPYHAEALEKHLNLKFD